MALIRNGGVFFAYFNKCLIHLGFLFRLAKEVSPFIFHRNLAGEGEIYFMEKQQNVEYLLSVHYLKKLRTKGFITYE